MVPRHPKWIIGCVNWDAFSQSLTFEDLEFPSAESTVVCVCSASDSLVSHHAIFTGPRRIPVPWWRDESRYAIRARKWALRYFNSYPTLENLISFKLFRVMVQ
jgi:hypothetical protein